MAEEVEKKSWVREEEEEENLTLINWWGTNWSTRQREIMFFCCCVGKSKMEWWAYACNRIKYLSNTKHQEKKYLNDGRKKNGKKKSKI